MGRDRILDSIDDVGEVTEAELVFAVEILVVLLAIELPLGPARECDQRSASIWSEEALLVVTQVQTLSVDFNVVKLDRPEELMKDVVSVQFPSTIVVVWVDLVLVVSTEHHLGFLVIWVQRHEE